MKTKKILKKMDKTIKKIKKLAKELDANNDKLAKLNSINQLK